MNGYSPARDGYGPGRVSPPQPADTNARLLVDGYTKDVMNNFASDAPRYNPLNTERTESSPLVDLKDPIQVHLLTETALTDSKPYEILSAEEVDDLKKQIQTFTQRIQQARANLTIQLKYRDAAISLSKLYSPGRQDGSRRKSLINRNSGGESAREAERERQAIEKKCEELAAELWSLEKRVIDPQRRLLEHTAGILQLTHKTPRTPDSTNAVPVMNGMPGSPESLYAFNGERNSLGPDDMYMDGPGNFQAFPTARGAPGGPIEPPLRSPQREQNTQLRDEADRLREENNQLRSQLENGEADSLRAENERLKTQLEMLSMDVESLRRQDTGRLQTVVDTEQRLEAFSQTLRNAIVTLDPSKSDTYQKPPSGPNPSTQPGDTVEAQFQYLEQGLRAIQETNDTQSSESLREAEAAAANASIALARAEIRLDSLNNQFRELLLGNDPDYPYPPDNTGAELDEQFDFADRSLKALEGELSNAAEAMASKALKKRDDDQSEAVLMGLWEIIQSGYADIRDRKDQRRKMRQDQGLEPDDDDMSGDEGVDLGEAYSLPAFSTKVQWLYAQATQLKDQKSVLKRQIKQQRELNNKSDSAKDAELQARQDEVDQVRELLGKSEQEAAKAQQLLSQALQDAESRDADRAAGEASVARAQEQLQERDAKITALEAEGKTLQQRMMDVSASVEAMEGRLNQADGEVAALATKLAEAEKLAEDRRQEAEEKRLEAEAKSARVAEQEQELENLNVALIETKTELTFCKAELDGAYGSRKERAVEAAAIQSTAEVEGLKSEVDRLKGELAATLKDLEGITAETIGAEREKLDFEGRLDDALAARASLELEVTSLRDQLDAEMRGARDKMARLQEELDAEKLKVVPGGGSRPGAGASMLSEQFRATMKQERRKFQEDLREEQAKRRKLEEELGRLRKAQGPGKSPLSPR